MKKIIKLVLVFIAFAILIPPTVLADAPAPPQSLHINLADDLPKTVAYFELLIPQNLSGAHFGSVNQAFQKKHPELINSQLADYHENGYISYSMYFNNANSPLLPMENMTDLEKKYDYNSFGKGNFKALTQFKIASIDQRGNILKVSPIVNMKPRANGFYVDVKYDYSKNTVSPYFYTEPFRWFISTFFRILFTIVLETLIAVPFKIRPLIAVIIANLLSEVILSIGMGVFSDQYVLSLVIFEAFVVLFEFFFLLFACKPHKPLRLTAFVLVANAASLGVGLWLDAAGVFIS